MIIRVVILSFLVSLVAGCTIQATASPVIIPPSSIPTNTSRPLSSATLTDVPATLQPASCDDWQSWPVTPVVGKTVGDVYARGQALGNQSQAFSKIGDGEISTAWFLSAFDLGPEHYDLGPYQNLRAVTEYFAGSFERIGMAAKRGFNTHRILGVYSEHVAPCESGESPLACELRLHQPAYAIISLGTNQVWEPDEFEDGMRQILTILLERDVVPILSTKGDNLEGDHRINRVIACLASEYDLPLWNFWAAIQPLPNHGLQPDLEHLTYGIPDFDDERAMQTAWTVRNLSALQALDAVWRGVTMQKQPHP
jgi:hypothetical protein